MEIKKLLEVIQTQRHDFLNHLQVISGLVQLNKVDRIREYISLALLEIGRMSETAKVKIPEVTAALLICLNEAAKYQVEVKLTVTSNLSDSDVNGLVLGETILSCLDAVIKSLARPDVLDRRLEITFFESGKVYICRLFFVKPLIFDLSTLEKAIKFSEDFSFSGGRVERVISDNLIEICLIIPRKQLENG